MTDSPVSGPLPQSHNLPSAAAAAATVAIAPEPTPLQSSRSCSCIPRLNPRARSIDRVESRTNLSCFVRSLSLVFVVVFVFPEPKSCKLDCTCTRDNEHDRYEICLAGYPATSIRTPTVLPPPDASQHASQRHSTAGHVLPRVSAILSSPASVPRFLPRVHAATVAVPSCPHVWPACRVRSGICPCAVSDDGWA